MKCHVDSAGRIVIPIELRRMMGFLEGTRLWLKFSPEENGIILRKYKQSCFCCGGMGGLLCLPNGIWVCADCVQKARNV